MRACKRVNEWDEKDDGDGGEGEWIFEMANF